MSSQPWYNQTDTYGKSTTDAQENSRVSATGKAVANGALKVAGATGRGIARGARAMSAFAANNPWGIRLFSFIASLSLFVIALLGLIGVVGTGAESVPLSFYLFNSYMLFLTLFLFIAECKDNWPVLGSMRGWVMDQFGFFQSNLGRGIFLVFIGLVWFGAWGWKWGILGLAVIVVGILYMIAHWAGSGVPASNDAPSASATIVTARPVAKPLAGGNHVILDEDDSDIV
jgi:hypothetical protein